MKAICANPGQPNSIHLREVTKPLISDVPNGRGVLVRVLRVGVDGTDKEINAAEYGAAPPGDNYLTLGHESFGIVEEVGANVSELKKDDYVMMPYCINKEENRQDAKNAMKKGMRKSLTGFLCDLCDSLAPWR